MTGPHGVVPILIDCDTGIDDALALLYAAAHGADLRACTVTHGNVPVPAGARNTLTVLDVAGLDTVPVHTGATRPLAQPLDVAHHVHGEDGLGDAGVTWSPRSPAGDLAPAEIVRLARAHPGELTLVAIGPLTNLGIALLLEPRLPELVDRVVVMGGAVGVPGNVTEYGEANVWHDPEAAQLVVDAAWDVVFVGLETTMPHPMSPDVLRRIEAGTDPRARFAWAILQCYLDFYEERLGVRSCVPHDALAVAVALDPELATYRTVPAFVETGRGPTRGTLVADLRPGSADAGADATAAGIIRIVETFDIDTFHERLLKSLGA
ncbi:nucleoside hydrolase [Nocardioides albidus]|uniref:Nucleoside hydrolase n=1 Tax=Nocardioides albidus TaxID=1517589 RepID=A0A5C4VL29_9ACTN|nr:nucleoside hydrolase [Nocardioides albidus]TNM36477.1 nucleoside hydrolase [Nocardioides albidus]